MPSKSLSLRVEDARTISKLRCANGSKTGQRWDGSPNRIEFADQSQKAKVQNRKSTRRGHDGSLPRRRPGSAHYYLLQPHQVLQRRSFHLPVCLAPDSDLWSRLAFTRRHDCVVTQKAPEDWRFPLALHSLSLVELAFHPGARQHFAPQP